MKTTSELRKHLAECFLMASDGHLSGDALRGVIGCANQINTSLAVEIKSRAMSQKFGETVSPIGEMKI